MTDVSVATLVGSLNQEATQQSVLSVMQGMAADIANGITATVNNFPIDYPDSNALSKLETIRVLLASTLAVSDSSTHTKLDSIISALGGTLSVNGSGVTQPVSFTRLSSTTDSVALGASSAVIGKVTADQLPSALGQLTAANSLSTTPASDAVHVVAGKAAVGSAPTVAPVGVSGVDGGGLKRSLLTDTSGALSVFDTTSHTSLASIDGKLPALIGGNVPIVRRNAVGTSSATISSAYVSGNAQVMVTLADGQNTYTAHVVPSGFTGTLLWVGSYDGLTWFPLLTQRTDSFGAAPATSASFTTSNATQEVRGNIPVGVSYIGCNASVASAGSVVVTLYASAVETPNVVSTASQLLASVARVGFVAKSGISFTESTTAVNANLTITGAGRLTDNTSSSTTWGSASSYGDRFVSFAGADQAGTLVVESSPDGTNWYPVTSAALAQVGGTGNYGAMLDLPNCGIQMRAKLVNGASNQSKAFLITKMKA